MRKALMYAGLAAAALLAVPVGAQPLPAPISAPDQVPSSQGLQLSEVLASSRRFAPAILEALANTRAADGRVLASEGAFDLLFSGEGFSRIAGFYDGTYVQGKAIQPLTNNGGQLEASYRVSRGDFPVYEDYSFTDRLGELKVRGVFALLRDRYIDDRRFGQRNALIERDIAGLDALLIAIGVQQRAIQAYGQWVAAGQQVRVYRALVGLAQDRQEGIRRQVQLGARAAILLTENEQNLLRRQSLLVAAERDLANAAQRLSLFWRDDDGRPRVATPASADLAADGPPVARYRSRSGAGAAARYPADRAAARAGRSEARTRAEQAAALAASVCRGGQGFRRAGTGRALARSVRGGGWLHFLDAAAEPCRQGQCRGGRGLYQRARMEAAAERGTDSGRDRAAFDQSDRCRATRRAGARRGGAGGEARRRRARLFQAGASDFFLVNLREDAAANAAIRRLDAEFRLAQARADLVAVAADLDALQLGEELTGALQP